MLVDEASALSIRFRLLGVPDRPYRALGAARVATLPGATHVLRQAESGIEAYVFWPELAPAAVRYRVEMDGVMGLRVVAGVVEFLDGHGTPRTRVRAPWVAGASSTGDASMDVVDCEVDRDPRAPWGRPVTPPGREACTLEVSWAKATGPVLMDPQWTFTGAMTRGRSSH